MHQALTVDSLAAVTASGGGEALPPTTDLKRAALLIQVAVLSFNAGAEKAGADTLSEALGIVGRYLDTLEAALGTAGSQNGPSETS